MLFFRRGRSAALFIPTVVDPEAPTPTEVASAVELSAAVAAITGFETTLNRIQQGVMKYAQEIQIDGPQTYGDASMTLLDDDGSGTDADSVARKAAYAALAEGVSGWLLLHPNKATGFAPTDKVELWPVKVGARNRSWSLDTEAARYTVSFAITGPAVKDAVIAAA